MSKFTLSLANDRIWQIDRLVEFLVANQGKDIILTVNPEAHDLESSGLYNILNKFSFSSVTIETHNQLETHSDYRFSYVSVDRFFQDVKKYDLTSTGIWNFSKVFGAFYGRPTANRIGIASYLHRHYSDVAEILLAADFNSADNRALYELDKLFVYDVESIVNFANLLTTFKCRSVDYTPHGHLFNYDVGMLNFYENIFVDIISEPNILGDTFFPTEKLVRPILMKKPFIAMASKNYLEYIRKMGFYTFSEFWDESYDGFEAADRYLKILRLIDLIGTKTVSELEEMYLSMAFQLEHNYNMALNQTYSKRVFRV